MGLSPVGSKFVEREHAHTLTLSLPKRKNTGTNITHFFHLTHLAFFGVYDGHTGKEAASLFHETRLYQLYCKQHLHEELDKLKSLSPPHIEKCFLVSSNYIHLINSI
jgi:serine/threonine protein phosphatase PrpC